MINERKCPACGKWTDGHKKHCTHCGALTDPTLLFEEKQQLIQKARTETALANQSKTAKRVKALKKSDKPFHRFIFLIADTLFTIYMAILSFIVWMIALITA